MTFWPVPSLAKCFGKAKEEPCEFEDSGPSFWTTTSYKSCS